jgi:hypothetical protein
MPLPSTTFVHGQTARPVDGWWQVAPATSWFDWGCDLFNAGCYFEAHELWELCWREAEQRGDVVEARTLRGLIRLAAAGVKLLANMEAARLRHVDGAVALLSSVEPTARISASSWQAAAAALRVGQRPELR